MVGSCGLPGAVRPRTPFGSSSVSASGVFGGRCGSRIFASSVTGPANVCSRGRRTVPSRPGQERARLVCRAGAVYRYPGALPPDPRPPSQGFPLSARTPSGRHARPTGPADHRTRENPPLPGSRRARSPGRTDRPRYPLHHHPTPPATPIKPQVRHLERVTSITRKAPKKTL